MNKLDENYVKTENADEADVILVRSAKMHEMEFGKNLKAIARAGAGVNNIPLDKCAEEGIVVFNTPGANAFFFFSAIFSISPSSSNSCTH